MTSLKVRLYRIVIAAAFKLHPIESGGLFAGGRFPPHDRELMDQRKLLNSGNVPNRLYALKGRSHGTRLSSNWEAAKFGKTII